MSVPAPGADVFVGRARELADLRGQLLAALGGRGRLVAIEGEAGIGKTRLVEEFLKVARSHEVPVRVGRAREDAGGTPLWPWRRLVPGLDAARRYSTADADAGAGVGLTARLQLFDDVTDALRADAEPAGLVLVLEDLHWADSATFALLCHVTAELHDARVLTVATFRDSSGALAELIREPGVALVRLSALTSAEVADYLARAGARSDPQWARFVHRRAAGNPLYVRVLGRVAPPGGADFDPAAAERAVEREPALRRLVAASLHPLGADCVRLVGAASAIGEDFDLRVLARACEQPSSDVQAAVDRAIRAGVLAQADRAGLYRFPHTLVRDAVYGDLAHADRETWHRRIAAALETEAGLSGREAERAAEIATHWSRAASDPTSRRRAARWARKAGRVAAADFAYEEAARFAELALSQLALSQLAASQLALSQLAGTAGRGRTATRRSRSIGMLG